VVTKKTSPVYQTGQTSWNMCVTIQCLHSKSIVVRNWTHVSYSKPFGLKSVPMMSYLSSNTGFNHQKTVVKHQHQWIEPTNIWNYKCCMIGFCLSITTTTGGVTLTKIHNLGFFFLKPLWLLVSIESHGFDGTVIQFYLKSRFISSGSIPVLTPRTMVYPMCIYIY